MRDLSRLRLGLALLVTCALAGTAVAAETKAKEAAGGRTRVLRSWPEDVTTAAGKVVPGRIDIVYDYDRGIAIWKTLDDKGVVLNAKEMAPGHGVPRPTPEEIAEAKDVVRADVKLERILRATKATMEGGFLLDEPAGKACGPGSRCIQIQMVSADGYGLVRWVVVDLNKRQMAYSLYSPSAAGLKKEEEEAK
jgi:hypothetical protein